jgi:hypothetical protein
LVVACLYGSVANAALVIETNADVGAGITAFGPAQRLLDWSGGFAEGSSWTLGSFGGPTIIGSTMTDAVTGSSVTGNIYVTNWIDGSGFDKLGAANPDLAINGTEDFLLSFAAPVNRVGFAVSTGRGLRPGEISSAGTRFALQTSTGESATFIMTDDGSGQTLWVDVQSHDAFTTLQFTEADGDLTDQYFGNFVSGMLPQIGGIPEPESWALLFLGFALTGAAMRRRGGISRVAA